MGVAGCDLALNDLQAVNFNMGQYKNAYALVLTNSGNCIIHPDAKLIGRNIKEAGEQKSTAGLLEAVKSGKTYSASETDLNLGGDVRKLFTPVAIGDTDTPDGHRPGQQGNRAAFRGRAEQFGHIGGNGGIERRTLQPGGNAQSHGRKIPFEGKPVTGKLKA